MKNFYQYFQFLFFFMLAIISFSLCVALTPIGNVLVFFIFNLIGQMLLNTFSFLSFYLILYPLVNWYVYRNNMLSKRFIFNWNYTVILFFTLTFWLKINSRLEGSNVINWFLSNFGIILGNFFIFLVLILEFIIWIYLNYVFFRNTNFILDTIQFLGFKFKILFESLYGYFPFLSSLRVKKDIKVYEDFDNELDKNKPSSERDNIINGEEYQALWSLIHFKTV